MKKYYCLGCGFVYNPAQEGGVGFNNLPEDWVCPVCGAPKSSFEVIHEKGEEQTGGEAQEKHVPVIEKAQKGVKVKIGLVAHPMTPEHYIEWVDLRIDPKGPRLKRVELLPDSAPEAIFEDIEYSKDLKAYQHCNIHGIWESE